MNKPMLTLLGSIAFTWLPIPPTFACANNYSSPYLGANVASQDLAEELRHVELKEPWTTRRDQLRKAMESGGDYKVKNDYAVALMHTGNPKGAIQNLEEIEKTKPGLYQTASNLGTAFELAGEDKKALEWIRKGIERDPKSHNSSEWLHVKILEAKIALSRGEAWESDGSILGLDSTRSSKPKAPTRLPVGNSGERLSLDRVESGLKYQLQERLQFVAPPDPVVASLLLDLGNTIAVKSGNFGLAQGIYELATSYTKSGEDKYKHVRELILARQRAAFESNSAPPYAAGPVKYWVMMASCAVIGVYLVLKVRDLARCW